jgi:hypothetical protein
MGLGRVKVDGGDLTSPFLGQQLIDDLVNQGARSAGQRVTVVSSHHGQRVAAA